MCTLEKGAFLSCEELFSAWKNKSQIKCSLYRGADKSLARPTSRCILFDGQNISFDASLVLYIYIYIYIYIYSINIPPIMIINT